jgi:signal peptidase II
MKRIFIKSRSSATRASRALGALNSQERIFSKLPLLPSVMLAVLALDQLSKYLLIGMLVENELQPIIVTGFFKLVMVWNYGVSFGMLAMPQSLMPKLLVGFALLVSLILWHLARRSADKYERICYAAIIGGALGNAADRVCYGAVADFFYFHLGDLGWPAFNVADAAIFCAVATLLFRSVWLRKRA